MAEGKGPFIQHCREGAGRERKVQAPQEVWQGRTDASLRAQQSSFCVGLAWGGNFQLFDSEK